MWPITSTLGVRVHNNEHIDTLLIYLIQAAQMFILN